MKKTLASLAIFAGWAVSSGFMAFPSGPRKVVMSVHMITLLGQVPHITRISAKNSGVVQVLDVFGQIWTTHKKMMISLITFPASKKSMAFLATFIGWVVSGGFTGFAGWSGKVAKKKSWPSWSASKKE